MKSIYVYEGNSMLLDYDLCVNHNGQCTIRVYNLYFHILDTIHSEEVIDSIIFMYHPATTRAIFQVRRTQACW